MLQVTLYDADLNAALEVEVDYLSFVAPTTYGPPPLIAPAKDRSAPRAVIDEEVLYVLTGAGESLPAVKVKRLSD